MFFIYVFIFFSMCILVLRTAYLQLIIPNELVREGDLRSLRMQRISMTRGMVVDREGRPLAVSVPVYAIWADPKEIGRHNIVINNDERWKALSEVLSLSLDQLLIRIHSNIKGRFVYLARQVDPSISEYILKLRLPGIYLRQESRRYYPSGCVSAHIVGITDIDGRGIEGIEKSFDAYLTGYPGARIIRKDRFGRVIENVLSIDSQDSRNIVLSIDERLQTLVYRELNNAVINNKAQSGSAILVDINTGEILAMVNIPSYNPNSLSTAALSSMRNSAITDLFEPGSTIKPIVIISALEHGVINENSIINTEPYVINGHMIKDVVHYNKLTVAEVLQKSSNVGVSRIALSMPSNVLMNAYSKFGIGKSTNLGLVGESNGIYPSDQRWSSVERAIFSYGYGFMVTPLQLVRVYATIGSMGVFRPLSILKVDEPVIGERLFPSSIVRSVIYMMENIALPGGTGAKAAVKGYRIAIKTGTAKKVGYNGKYINKYIAYTAGVAPASHPRFALVVIVNEPHNNKYYGGLVSAPVFSAIMSSVLRMMNVEPDGLSIY
ncbi:peptidoglycan glycosyltransferase FtsI [Blochmannia endosymbiont of Camponotus (Colobopsis) obliquus]|uniref:peptidoglycan glycosyltransferase FtsI n=1 Tax=Blochmannia endosymbiont of Camponotus (Colobopsis) obliquus TaxID=1505597 RepID=UPI0023A9B45B|nr:peptidoglycan glycosyltransferase FtsI [Blochmannia endosymbiont of Camponotus (Colobopsis) obliquus]